MANYRYHLRCTSLPSASHPLATMIEENLNILRCWCWVDSTSSTNTEKLHIGIRHLTSLYDSVDDLLHLPHIQQVLVHHRDENFVDKVLDGSLRLLDVSSTIRDVLLRMKEHVQQTRSVLRRRRGEFKLRNEIDGYMHARRKINKVIHKCLRNLRKMVSKHSLFSQNDQDLVTVVHVLKEVETLTLSVCESLLRFLSGSRTSLKPSGWSLVSNLMHKKRIKCEEQHLDSNEVEMLQKTMLVLSSHKCHEVKTLQKAQVQLEVLETSIRSLEDGLECVFRRLIKTRVSVLNILNN
ncbi:hypothetical protein FRX31_006154 [Thalictrum thalictroides]|uniref:DUF241 domain protein n=1 Tax=Thalictrum thalictroides TaxID=46969 RepID=A0A7J6X6Q9_THATH|nr:hypothetical protein FRX31_006154 [Thalictrum thalictroides]